MSDSDPKNSSRPGSAEPPVTHEPQPSPEASPRQTDDSGPNADGPIPGSGLPVNQPTARGAGTGAPSRRIERPSIKNLTELLAAVYGGVRKVPQLTGRDLAAMQTAAEIAPEDLQRLLRLAESDRTLERTRLLMVFSLERLHGTSLATGVRDFVRAVLRSHPAFQTPILVTALQGNADGSDEEDTVRALATRAFESLPWTIGLPPLKKTQVAQCRANALVCLLVWLQESKGTSLDRVLRCLQGSVWAPTGRRKKTDRQRMKALISTRDASAAAIVCELFDAQLYERTQEAATARKSEERTAIRAQQAEVALADCGDRFTTAQNDARQSREQLHNERQERETENAHFRDDYQKLKGRLLQRLKEEVLLLDEGLHALRRDPPKLHVMLDHAERVMDNLKREMERLRGEE